MFKHAECVESKYIQCFNFYDDGMISHLKISEWTIRCAELLLFVFTQHSTLSGNSKSANTTFVVFVDTYYFTATEEDT